MKAVLATICLIVMLVPATPAAADEIGWSEQWLGRLVDQLTAIVGQVGGALVPTGEPVARTTAQDEDPDQPKTPLDGNDPNGPDATIPQS